MHDDDRPIGRILNRREVLGLFGAAGAALLVGCSDNGDEGGATAQPTAAATTSTTTAGQGGLVTNAACVVRPQLTEGPYFVDVKLNRSDIRSDPTTGAVRQGVPFVIAFNVSSIASNACSPLAGANVDVWHCDALGVYSGVSDMGFTTTGQQFLRGFQATDSSGKATFTTIYPGWYQGRAVHVHFKIRTASNWEFTSQFFLDESLTDIVHAQQPYAAKGNRTLRNEGDSIFNQGGSQLLLTPTRSGDGYAATFDIALDLADASIGASDSAGQGGPGSQPPGGMPAR